MKDAQLIPGLLILAAIALGVCYAVMRSVLREMHGGLEDKDESPAARRTEERKNERIRKEIEKWREGR
jgi:hypothetical protein